MAPGADRVALPLLRCPRPRRSRAASPPWSRASSSACSIGAVDRDVGGLEAEHERRAAALVGVRDRRLGLVEQPAVGGVEPRLRERAHRLGARREGLERDAGRELVRGRSCTRTQASVITPRMPSEPISIRSGLGPAPDPGSRRLSHSPAGVIARTDSTRSSMWVQTVAKWPPARVAIQPPRVEYSNDCGKWRRVSPCSASCSLSGGPSVPAWIRAARETGSTSSTRSSAPRSIVTAPAYSSPIRGSTPPTTLVPPP